MEALTATGTSWWPRPAAASSSEPLWEIVLRAGLKRAREGTSAFQRANARYRSRPQIVPERRELTALDLGRDRVEPSGMVLYDSFHASGSFTR
jgi:hypothetical protein